MDLLTDGGYQTIIFNFKTPYLKWVHKDLKARCTDCLCSCSVIFF